MYLLPILKKKCNINTFITANWKSIYIDKDLFLDERRQSRLRFSLAHEIGHYILHKSFYSAFKIDSLKTYYDFVELMSSKQYYYLESQANRFASYLLIPRELLKKELSKELKKVDKNNFDKELLKSYIANPISKKFGVSQEAMKISLNEFNFDIN